jgi:peptidoglycan/xylan/chitin deacetylase (PgdA/CDA1 family)
MSPKFKVAVLAGSDSRATCLALERLLELPAVEVCGVLFDTEALSLRRRWRNFRRNIRREGVSYAWHRLADAIVELLENLAARVVSREEVNQLLRESFPERISTLFHLPRMRGIQVFEVANLNSAKASEVLRGLQADLGIVLGTRVLQRSTFSIPRLGSLNLHKGKVPEYRGLPPGFWELYEGQATAGVTVHFIDENLDTGDIVAETSVEIHPKDSPETLRTKLDVCGAELLAACVSRIADGTAMRRPQTPSSHRPRTAPTRNERHELERRLKLPPQTPRWIRVAKTSLYLTIYYTGIYHLVCALNRKFPKGRSCILLYHRVNNLTQDQLTTSVKRFAEHLAAIRRHYRVVTTAELVESVKQHKRPPASTVAIHFDDCYRDVYTNAAPMLARSRMPACVFVSSGFINTSRVFPHDAGKTPLFLENFKTPELPGLVGAGFEIGAHTVNHVDLGQVRSDVAAMELSQSKTDLQEILGGPINLISYPYGRKRNITSEVKQIARRIGYEAMFSAYGGFVNSRSDTFDIRRVGVGDQHRPLDLLMEIEGISLAALKRAWSGEQTDAETSN